MTRGNREKEQIRVMRESAPNGFILFFKGQDMPEESEQLRKQKIKKKSVPV